jgi:superfamily I DNA/RNA helicase
MTASMIPELNDAEIENIPSKAEQTVYINLKAQLPKEWLVVHSLEFIKENQNSNRHSDREADFVVFAPEYGLLVVEVKGGGIEYDKKTDKWFSVDRNRIRHLIKNPIRQAKDAKYEIRRHLSKHLGNKDILLAHAAIFPDLLDSKPLTSPDIPIEILGDRTSISDIQSWIVEVFNYWCGNDSHHQTFGLLGIRAAEQVFGKSICINHSLKVALETESQKQFELTNQQKNILRQLKKRKRALIEGGAGTGKTVLAIDHAQGLATIGNKVLFLCYNQNLANFLKKRIVGFSNLHIMSFHEYCSWRIKQVLSNTGRDLIDESKVLYPMANLYDVIMPDALAESLDIAPLFYDTIIIDEAQDFKDEYWLPIELMLEAGTEINFYVFQDCNQAIYTNSEQLPINSEPLLLLDNCRNTSPIHELAYKYYKGIETEKPDVLGEPVELLIESNDVKKQAKTIADLVDKLIRIEKIDPEDIVITTIGNFNIASDALNNTSQANVWAFKQIEPKKKVLVETAKRFKGLESKLLIVWVLDDSQLTDKVLYVAISRARLRLWIVGSDALHNQIGMQ